jgi:di/tricarboxylate transporter
VVIFSGCISQDKAYQSIEWKILMMIFGMLALSQAIEITGIGKVVVEGLAATFSGYGPWVVLGMVYVLTSIATEVISNNAVAVLLTPIVIGLAQSMGVDARPFIVAVMFGASASFATPIGYQTNTFVYNAGNYRFKDFLKVGVPMNIIIAIVAITIIPFFWDF